MYILFSLTLPDPGHFNPLVPVARALQAAGHEIAFATLEAFRPAIEAHGFQLLSAGVDITAAVEVWPNFLELSKDPPATQAGTDRFIAEIFIGFLGKHKAKDVLGKAQAKRPDLIVRDDTDLGACVAAEVLGIPHVAISISGFRPLEEQKRVLGPALDGLRGAFGLAPDPDLEMPYRYLYLNFLPPSFMGPNVSLPPTTQFLQPAIFDQLGINSLPAWVSTLGARPVVYASLGTTLASRTPGVFPKFLEALQDEPLDLIMTVGQGQDPADFGPQPPNVHIERYIPQTLIFPRCDLVITHGGFNTMLSAVYHGLPLLITPIMVDQPLNAARCVQLGVAQKISIQELSVDGVKSAVRSMLQDPRYREKAVSLQREMQSLPKLDKAVERITALTAKR